MFNKSHFTYFGILNLDRDNAPLQIQVHKARSKNIRLNDKFLVTILCLFSASLFLVQKFTSAPRCLTMLLLWWFPASWGLEQENNLPLCSNQCTALVYTFHRNSLPLFWNKCTLVYAFRTSVYFTCLLPAWVCFCLSLLTLNTSLEVA